MIVAAPTGVAAINAGGVTLHSIFQLPFHPFIPSPAGRDELVKKIKFNKERLILLRKTELLVIDEISMVRSDTMDAIDTILRSVRKNYSEPFGGIQLLVIGDLHQLPPVIQHQEWTVLQNYYASAFFFDSYAMKEAAPLLIGLEKIYRQNDLSFVELLNHVRINKMLKTDFKKLEERFIPEFVSPHDIHYITLTSHNKKADIINNDEIRKLTGQSFSFTAEIKNEFPENMFPTDGCLILKEGAQVMFIKNDTVQRRYFNGKIGTIAYLDKETITVDCAGEKIDVTKEEWENTRYNVNKKDGKLEQEVIGTFIQYPLRLAWAITIHKSQGLTFNHVIIDAAAAFGTGQVYVALSRCTSLEGIVLSSQIPATAIQNNTNVEKAYAALTHSGSMDERFVNSRSLFTVRLLEEIFSFSEISDSLSDLKNAVLSNRIKLNTDAGKWIESFSQKFQLTKKTGLAFLRQVSLIMDGHNLIENNMALQNRITAAAGHFIPLLENDIFLLKNNPVITEHKEVSDIINPLLNSLNTQFSSLLHLMRYCQEPFSVTSFLRYKLNYSSSPSNISSYSGNRNTTNTGSPNPELYHMLKDWRDKLCGETGIPVYLVAAHAALKDICTYLPEDRAGLLLISGFGKARIEKYGDEIIDLVVDFCKRNNLQTNIRAIPTSDKKIKSETKNKKKTKAPDTKSITLEMLKAGKKLKEIAKERGLAESSIVNHLCFFLASGVVEIKSLLTDENILKISTVIKNNSGRSLTEIKTLLPDHSYNDIKMMIISLGSEKI